MGDPTVRRWGSRDLDSYLSKVTPKITYDYEDLNA